MAFDSKGTLNKVMLIGRLGHEPELKYTASGAAVLTLRIATDTSYKSQDGNYVNNTEWHRIVIWRKRAEAISQYAKKGTRIYVEGRLQTRSWDDKDGITRYTTEIQADSVQLLDSKAEGESSSSVKEPPSPEAPKFEEPTPEQGDDLPF